MDLGTRIRSWREWKGWNQKQLAEKAGIPRASMCVYEGGGKRVVEPPYSVLVTIVSALGLTMTRFHGEIPKPKKLAKATKPTKRAAA